MSLEESMAALAESNLKLAAANTEAAKLYAAVLERFDAGDVAGDTAKPAAAAAAPKKGRPAKAKPGPEPEQEEEEEEDDGLGGGTANRSEDEVKAILKQYKEAGGAPKDIMGKFGARAFPEVKPADFNAVYEATEKALAKL